MLLSQFIVFLAATLVKPGSAFIRFGCSTNLVEQRADPIIFPNQVSDHAHKIAGGNGFGFAMDYAKARLSKCSSCPVKEDMSNYWTPKLYYRYQNNTFQSVPTVGDNMNDQNGGMTVYYLQRGPAAADKTLKAFPEGFRMLAGYGYKRNFTGDFAAKAVNFNCLGAGKDETNGFPNYNCPGGLRAQIFFPSCWDGKNLDSADHRSHMAYPASGAYNNGPCPSTHPVQLVSLFFEILYDTSKFKDMWYGNTQPFVLSSGDATGYGFHGDFVNGWDVPTLQKVVDTCTDPNAQGVLEKCSAITQFTTAEQNSCRQAPQINEQVSGFLPALPGCNPVTFGPERAPSSPVCSNQGVSKIGSGPATFTDMTSKGWTYQGCAADGNPRTLSGKTTMYSAGVAEKMTVEYCMDMCKDFAYAGLEYAGECWCGNTVAADRAPKDGILGNCNMKCKGNPTDFCGGAGALSLYKKCTGPDCKNAGSGGSGGSGGTDSSYPVPASPSVVSPNAPSVLPVSKVVTSMAAVPSVNKQVGVGTMTSANVVTVTVTQSACSFRA